MTVQLALYIGKGQIGNAAIRWWTGSIYSHCELVVEGKCYSSSLMDKGVRCKRVGNGKDEISLSSKNWDLIELPWADVQHVKDYFVLTDHHRYGWYGLIVNQIFNRNRTLDDAQFCSEWCARAIGLPNPSSLSPHGLGDLCTYLNTPSLAV